MPYVTVNAQVDLEDVLDDLDEDDLQAAGYAKVDRGEWEKVGTAIRANDIAEVLRLVSELAYGQAGVLLPPLRLAPSQQPAASSQQRQAEGSGA